MSKYGRYVVAWIGTVINVIILSRMGSPDRGDGRLIFIVIIS
jgi:hypothetical protein